LPPVESCRGTSPIQAAKSRPDRNALASVTVAVMALAPRKPIPGMVATRLLASLARCCGLPVVGYLNSGLPQHADELLAFHKGLGEFGYVDSRNVAVEARWANNELSRRRPTF